ncbi:MAG: hypothetical protein ACI837_003506, partial [Crocinitomicaceae bacterium]
ADYNLALSQDRINSVKARLDKFQDFTFTYFEKNLGESEFTPEARDLTLARRVDLFVIPMSNNQITIPDGNAEVTVPLDYFQPCGVCQSQPKIDAYYTPEEARVNDIEFQTTNGIDLISAGTFDFNFKPCNESNKIRVDRTICYTVRSAQVDTDMLLWEPDTINGVIYWKPSSIKPEFDTINGTYTFCSPCRLINLDKPKLKVEDLYIFPPEFEYLRSEFTFSDPIPVIKTLKDTLKIDNFIVQLTSFAKMGDTLFHMKALAADLPITKSDTALFLLGRPVDISNEHKIDRNQYKIFVRSASDTAVMIKLKNKPTQVGYYLRDVHDFIPIENSKRNRRFYGQLATGDYEFAYIRGKNVYVLPTNKIKMRYQKWKHRYKMKFNRKSIRGFKRDKTYRDKRKEWDDFFGR